LVRGKGRMGSARNSMRRLNIVMMLLNVVWRRTRALQIVARLQRYYGLGRNKANGKSGRLQLQQTQGGRAKCGMVPILTVFNEKAYTCAVHLDYWHAPQKISQGPCL
jgi:hypothetical protein